MERSGPRTYDGIRFERVAYDNLNSRQQEIFNFQKVSGLLADFGFATLRLTDDWNCADFLAVHFDGVTLLKVQLKGRLTFEKKYQGKDLWICFRHKGLVYLFPHDKVLAEVLMLTRVAGSASWSKAGGSYSFPVPPRALRRLLRPYCLGQESEPAV